MKTTIIPDAWATLSPEGEYCGTDDEIHLDRIAPAFCPVAEAEHFHVEPVCLIAPERVEFLHALERWALRAYAYIENVRQDTSTHWALDEGARLLCAHDEIYKPK